MTPRADQPTVAAVRAAARRGGLDRPRPVVALVSGGRDSVCLLDVAVALLGPGLVQVLHVDYGLRPESGADADHVRALGDRLAVVVNVVAAQRPPAAGNTQSWARDLRYAHATRLAEAAGDDALVLTGHTASDQVETVIYRLAASPGRRALLGMPAARGRLLRPLLAVTREQTGAYCVERGLSWRDDASNEATAPDHTAPAGTAPAGTAPAGTAPGRNASGHASTTYARARVRGTVMPALRELHPAAEANLLRTIALLNDEAAVLDELVARELAGRRAIALARLAELPPALARLVVLSLAEQAKGTLAPQAAGRLPELLALGRGGGSAALDLPGGLRAIVEYGVLRFSAQGEDPVPEPVTLPIPGSARFGAWAVHCERAAPAPPAGARPPAGSPAQPPLLDGDVLGSAALLVRPWRAGDRMDAGGAGTRTLADLFTDRRVPRGERRTIPVVEAGGQIAWVAGLATARRFRATVETRHPLRLSAERVAP